MAFKFCWEHKGCTKACRAKDLQVLFCWHLARNEGYLIRKECVECDYRRRWVAGEFSTREFVDRYERRRGPRSVKRILVIDDEPNILYALEETVRGRGFECIAACDGEEGILIARSVRPDLVISDIIMPRINGIDLCRILKNDPETSRMPVVLVTVRAAEKDIQQGNEAGADGYLVKPFQVHDLERLIEQLVSR